MKKMMFWLIATAGFFWAPIASAVTFTSISSNYHSVDTTDSTGVTNHYYGADALPIAPILGTHLESSITFSDAVTPSFTGLAYAAQVTSWNLTSGLVTLTQDNSYIVYAWFPFVNGQLTDTFVMFSQDITLPVKTDLTLFYSNIFLSYRDHDTGIIKAGTITDPWQASAVTAVPEPITNAMLIAGIGLLGLVTRRRKS